MTVGCIRAKIGEQRFLNKLLAELRRISTERVAAPAHPKGR